MQILEKSWMSWFPHASTLLTDHTTWLIFTTSLWFLVTKKNVLWLFQNHVIFKAETQSDFLLNGLDLGERTHQLNWNSPAIWMSQRNSRDAVPLIFRDLFGPWLGFIRGLYTAENPETARECSKLKIPMVVLFESLWIRRCFQILKSFSLPEN